MAGAASDEVLRELSKLFKLLSDETRLHILANLLRKREMHVRALCDVLGQSQPAVSHHLALLRVAGVIEARREGKHNFYHIRPSKLQELLDLSFSSLPRSERKFRIVDYVLQYAPDANGDAVLGTRHQD